MQLSFTWLLVPERRTYTQDIPIDATQALCPAWLSRGAAPASGRHVPGVVPGRGHRTLVWVG